jgi:hypothetical protein
MPGTSSMISRQSNQPSTEQRPLSAQGSFTSVRRGVRYEPCTAPMRPSRRRGRQCATAPRTFERWAFLLSHQEDARFSLSPFARRCTGEGMERSGSAARDAQAVTSGLGRAGRSALPLPLPPKGKAQTVFECLRALGHLAACRATSRAHAESEPDGEGQQQLGVVLVASCARNFLSVGSAAVSTSASASTVYISHAMSSASRTQNLSAFA